MPIYSIPVTLSEVLEVRGTALMYDELWALLYATSKYLSDLFIRGTGLMKITIAIIIDGFVGLQCLVTIVLYFCGVNICTR